MTGRLMTDGQFASIMDIVERHATEREINAGFASEQHDGGAGILRTQVEFFRHGMNRTLPAKWLQFVQELERQNDPEWRVYLRLKNKFED